MAIVRRRSPKGNDTFCKTMVLHFGFHIICVQTPWWARNNQKKTPKCHNRRRRVFWVSFFKALRKLLAFDAVHLIYETFTCISFFSFGSLNESHTCDFNQIFVLLLYIITLYVCIILPFFMHKQRTIHRSAALHTHTHTHKQICTFKYSLALVYI